MSKSTTASTDRGVQADPQPRLVTLADAMMEAIGIALEEDPAVFVMGEDIGRMGGVAGQTRGLFDLYGGDRLIDTPISEAAFFGLAAGAAQNGMRPIVELMRVDFIGAAMDQVFNYIAKVGYATGGRRRIPITITTQIGNPLRQGAVHAQVLTGLFAHLPGLKVVAPSTSADAKGLLLSAIRCDDPVVYLFHAGLLALTHGPGLDATALDVPEGEHTVEIGSARLVRRGSDATLVSYSLTVHDCLRAAGILAADGIECDVIDLRSIVPLDRELVASSVARTGRLAVVDEDYGEFGVAAEIIAGIAEAGVNMHAAPCRVARAQVPVPYSQVLDDAVRPTPQKIVDAVRLQF